MTLRIRRLPTGGDSGDYHAWRLLGSERREISHAAASGEGPFATAGAIRNDGGDEFPKSFDDAQSGIFWMSLVQIFDRSASAPRNNLIAAVEPYYDNGRIDVRSADNPPISEGDRTPGDRRRETNRRNAIRRRAATRAITPALVSMRLLACGRAGKSPRSLFGSSAVATEARAPRRIAPASALCLRSRACLY